MTVWELGLDRGHSKLSRIILHAELTSSAIAILYHLLFKCSMKKLHSTMSLPYIKISVKTNMELSSRFTGFFHALSALNPHRGISQCTLIPFSKLIAQTCRIFWNKMKQNHKPRNISPFFFPLWKYINKYSVLFTYFKMNFLFCRKYTVGSLTLWP